MSLTCLGRDRGLNWISGFTGEADVVRQYLVAFELTLNFLHGFSGFNGCRTGNGTIDLCRGYLIWWNLFFHDSHLN